MSSGRDEQRRAALAAVAPGTALREGLERILRGNTGALIVLGYDQSVAGPVLGRLRAQRAVLRHPAARAGQDGRRHRAGRDRAAPSCAPPSSWCPTRGCPPASPAPGTAPPSASPGRPATRSSRSASRCASSPSTPAAPGTCSRTPRPSCRGRTRPWPPWSGTSSGSTRSPGRCRPWRSRTWPRSGTSPPWPSGWRWSAGSPTRSRATWSSSAPTAGCWPSSWTSCGRHRAAAPVPGPGLRARRAGGPAPAPRPSALAELADLSADELLDCGAVAAVLGLGGTEHLDDSVSPHGYRLLARSRGCPARSSTP